MANDITKANQNVPATIYKPSEIIGIFNSILAKQSLMLRWSISVVYISQAADKVTMATSMTLCGMKTARKR